MHVLDDIPNVSITFEKPNGVEICISSKSSSLNPKKRLFEVSDYTWLGLFKLDDNEIWEQYHVKANKLQTNNFTGIAMQGIEEEMAVLKRVMGSNWMTTDRIRLLNKAYLAKADAVEQLHSQLGHLTYPYIKMMILQGNIKAITLNRK
jgi:hypothetical protein